MEFKENDILGPKAVSPRETSPMDEILHHLRIPGMLSPLANTNKQGFQWFHVVRMDFVDPEYDSGSFSPSRMPDLMSGVPRATCPQRAFNSGFLVRVRRPQAMNAASQQSRAAR